MEALRNYEFPTDIIALLENRQNTVVITKGEISFISSNIFTHRLPPFNFFIKNENNIYYQIKQQNEVYLLKNKYEIECVSKNKNFVGIVGSFMVFSFKNSILELLRNDLRFELEFDTILKITIFNSILIVVSAEKILLMTDYNIKIYEIYRNENIYKMKIIEFMFSEKGLNAKYSQNINIYEKNFNNKECLKLSTEKDDLIFKNVYIYENEIENRKSSKNGHNNLVDKGEKTKELENNLLHASNQHFLKHKNRSDSHVYKNKIQKLSNDMFKNETTDKSIKNEKTSFSLNKDAIYCEKYITEKKNFKKNYQIDKNSDFWFGEHDNCIKNIKYTKPDKNLNLNDANNTNDMKNTQISGILEDYDNSLDSNIKISNISAVENGSVGESTFLYDQGFPTKFTKNEQHSNRDNKLKPQIHHLRYNVNDIFNSYTNKKEFIFQRTKSKKIFEFKYQNSKNNYDQKKAEVINNTYMFNSKENHDVSENVLEKSYINSYLNRDHDYIQRISDLNYVKEFSKSKQNNSSKFQKYFFANNNLTIFNDGFLLLINEFSFLETYFCGFYESKIHDIIHKLACLMRSDEKFFFYLNYLNFSSIEETLRITKISQSSQENILEYLWYSIQTNNQSINVKIIDSVLDTFDFCSKSKNNLKLFSLLSKHTYCTKMKDNSSTNSVTAIKTCNDNIKYEFSILDTEKNPILTSYNDNNINYNDHKSYDKTKCDEIEVHQNNNKSILQKNKNFSYENIANLTKRKIENNNNINSKEHLTNYDKMMIKNDDKNDNSKIFDSNYLFNFNNTHRNHHLKQSYANFATKPCDSILGCCYFIDFLNPLKTHFKHVNFNNCIFKKVTCMIHIYEFLNNQINCVYFLTENITQKQIKNNFIEKFQKLIFDSTSKNKKLTDFEEEKIQKSNYYKSIINNKNHNQSNMHLNYFENKNNCNLNTQSKNINILNSKHEFSDFKNNLKKFEQNYNSACSNNVYFSFDNVNHKNTKQSNHNFSSMSENFNKSNQLYFNEKIDSKDEKNTTMTLFKENSAENNHNITLTQNSRSILSEKKLDFCRKKNGNLTDSKMEELKKNNIRPVFTQIQDKTTENEILIEIRKLLSYQEIAKFKNEELDHEKRNEKTFCARFSACLGVVYSSALYNEDNFLAIKKTAFKKETNNKIVEFEPNLSIYRTLHALFFNCNSAINYFKNSVKTNYEHQRNNIFCNFHDIEKKNQKLQNHNLIDSKISAIFGYKLNSEENCMITPGFCGAILGLGISKELSYEMYINLSKKEDDLFLLCLHIGIGFSLRGTRDDEYLSQSLTKIKNKPGYLAIIGILFSLCLVFEKSNNFSIIEIIINEISKKGSFDGGENKGNRLWYDETYKTILTLGMCHLLDNNYRPPRIKNSLCDLILNGFYLAYTKKEAFKHILQRDQYSSLEEIFYSSLFICLISAQKPTHKVLEDIQADILLTDSIRNLNIHEIHSISGKIFYCMFYELYQNRHVKNKCSSDIINCQNNQKKIEIDFLRKYQVKEDSNFHANVNEIFQHDRYLYEFNTSSDSMKNEFLKTRGNINNLDDRNLSNYHQKNTTIDINNKYFNKESEYIYNIAFNAEKSINSCPKLQIILNNCLIYLSIKFYSTNDLTITRFLRRLIKKSDDIYHLKKYDEFYIPKKNQIQFGLRYGDILLYKICLSLISAPKETFIQFNKKTVLNLISTFFIKWPLCPEDSLNTFFLRYFLLESIVQRTFSNYEEKYKKMNSIDISFQKGIFSNKNSSTKYIKELNKKPKNKNYCNIYEDYHNFSPLKKSFTHEKIFKSSNLEQISRTKPETCIFNYDDFIMYSFLQNLKESNNLHFLSLEKLKQDFHFLNNDYSCILTPNNSQILKLENIVQNDPNSVIQSRKNLHISINQRDSFIFKNKLSPKNSFRSLPAKNYENSINEKKNSVFNDVMQTIFKIDKGFNNIIEAFTVHDRVFFQEFSNINCIFKMMTLDCLNDYSICFPTTKKLKIHKSLLSLIGKYFINQKRDNHFFSKYN